MRTFKRIMKIAGVVLALFLVNELLIFAMEPYGSRVQSKWADYHETQTMDTVILGTSLIEDGINPFVLDEEYGTNSINMGSGMQEIEESYLALREMLKEHPELDTVILGVDLAYYQDERSIHPSSPFLRNKNLYRPVVGTLSDMAFLIANTDFYTTADSLNWMFPYIYNHVPGSPSKILQNMRNKALHEERVQDVAARRIEMEPWMGKGYCNSGEEYDFTRGGKNTYREQQGKKDLEQSKLDHLEQFCELCRSNGVRLVVVCAPLPSFQVLDFGEIWYPQIETLKGLVEAHGASFYDFDMVHRDLYSFDERYYFDMQHMNEAGATAFTKAVVKVLKAEDAGEDCSQFFYTADEYKKSFDTVQYAQLKSTKVDVGIQMKARAIMGQGKKAEYQFLARQGDGEWQVVRDYGTSSSFTYKPSARGTYQVRVNARVVGSTAEYEKTSKMEVRY